MYQLFLEILSLLEDSYRGKENAISTKNSLLIETTKAKSLDEYSVLVENNKSKFYIPENIYFIGMMNDVDKSIDCFDLALRRRFTWVLKKCDYDILSNANLGEDYIKKCKVLNYYITGQQELIEDEKQDSNQQTGNKDTLNLGRAYEIGHSYFLKKQDFNEVAIYENHIEPILREYARSQFGDNDIEQKLSKAKDIFVVDKDEK